MPIYLCRWPNGDASVVEAQDRDEAAMLFDEFGDADEGELHELEGFLLDFRLDDDGCLQVNQWGESTRSEIFARAYPALEAALLGDPDGRWEPGVRPVPEPIRQALEFERSRLSGGRAEEELPEARTGLGRELQKALGAPAALADRLLEQVGERILEKVKLKGPKH